MYRDCSPTSLSVVTLLVSVLLLLYFVVNMEQEYFDEILCPSVADTGQKCGKPLQRHHKFCHDCGCKVSPIWFLKQTTVPQVDTCPGIDEEGKVCGWQLDSSMKFCSNCGARSMLNACWLLVYSWFYSYFLLILLLSLLIVGPLVRLFCFYICM